MFVNTAANFIPGFRNNVDPGHYGRVLLNPVTRRGYLGGKLIANETIPTTFEPLTTSALEEIDRLQKTIQNNYQISRDPQTQRWVGFSWANQDPRCHDEGNITLVVTTRTASIMGAEYVRELAAMAFDNPESSFVFVENPGAGNSDPLPWEIMYRQTRSGSFIEAAGILCRVLSKAKIYPNCAASISLGARYLVGVAGHQETKEQFNKVMYVDPPGYTRKTSPLIRFALHERTHGAYYRQTSTDPLYKRKPSAVEHSISRNLDRKIGEIVQKSLSEPLTFALNRDGFNRDIEAVIQNQTSAQIISLALTLSELRDPRFKPSEFIETLSMGRSSLTELWEWLAGHSAFQGTPRMFGKFVLAMHSI